VDSSGITFILNLVKICRIVQKLKFGNVDTHARTHAEHGESQKLEFFFSLKEGKWINECPHPGTVSNL